MQTFVEYLQESKVKAVIEPITGGGGFDNMKGVYDLDFDQSGNITSGTLISSEKRVLEVTEMVKRFTSIGPDTIAGVLGHHCRSEDLRQQWPGIDEALNYMNTQRSADKEHGEILWDAVTKRMPSTTAIGRGELAWNAAFQTKEGSEKDEPDFIISNTEKYSIKAFRHAGSTARTGGTAFKSPNKRLANAITAMYQFFGHHELILGGPDFNKGAWIKANEANVLLKKIRDKEAKYKKILEEFKRAILTEHGSKGTICYVGEIAETHRPFIYLTEEEFNDLDVKSIRHDKRVDFTLTKAAFGEGGNRMGNNNWGFDSLLQQAQQLSQDG